MKIYRCRDCKDTDIPGCELRIDGDTQPPNVCPYRYGETWEKNGGKCGFEFVGVSAEMSMGEQKLPTWRCDCGILNLYPFPGTTCFR